MPEQEQQGAQQAQQAQQGATLRVREQDVKTAYANMCLIFSTREEVILDFGLALPAARQQDQPPQANMVVSNRIVMGLPAAKRLAIALSQSIQRYESNFGVIELEHRPPQSPGGEA